MKSLTNLGSWPSQPLEIDKKPDKEFRQGFIRAPAATEGSDNMQLCLLAGWGGELVPYIGQGQGSGQKGGLGGLTSPLVVSCAGGLHGALLIALGSSEVAVGFFSFLGVSLNFIVHNLPQLLIHAVIFIPDSFFAFCCSSRGLSRCKHCSKKIPRCSLSQNGGSFSGF